MKNSYAPMECLHNLEIIVTLHKDEGRMEPRILPVRTMVTPFRKSVDYQTIG